MGKKLLEWQERGVWSEGTQDCQGGVGMKCSECNLYWFDEEAGCAICHADPNWPAPCEYDEEDDEEDE